MTLAELYRLRCVLAIRRLLLAAGLDVHDIRSRVRRGGPELTRDESQRILNVLRSAGLTYDVLLIAESDDRNVPAHNEREDEFE